MAKNRVVAIDIGTNTAKMVQLELSSTAVHLINANVVTYPDAADRQHVVESIARLWASLDDPPKQRNLRSLFSRDKAEIALALPRFFVSTKRLGNLPAATDDQLANIVAISAETELPFRPDEAIFTYHDVRRTAEAVSVELISTRHSTVTDYLTFLEQIGVSASAVIPSTIAIAEVAAKSGCTQPTFIVDIGAEQTDFCFIQDGALRFSRSFRLGENHLSEHVSQALNTDIETAAQEKQYISAREAPTSTWTAQFIGELQRSIAAAKTHRETNGFGTAENAGGTENPMPSATETELWLCGSGARLPELTTACETELNITTQLWNPVHAIEQHFGINTDLANAEAKVTLDEWGDTLAVPLGVALNTLNPITKVSLLPKEAVETLTQATRQRQIFAAAGLGVLMIGGLLFGGYALQRSQQQRSEALDTQLAHYAQPMALAKAQLGRELAITEMLTHHISPLDILHTFSAMFRDRTQIAWTNLNITNLHTPETARITFNLESSSHNAINSLLRVLNRSDVFTNVQAGEVTTTTQNRKQIFQVQVRCNLTPYAVQAFAKKRYPMPQPSTGEAAMDAELNISLPSLDTIEEKKNETKE
ncbi:MAG: pilus assembly protein PilM [Candidatus Poribacteria bacterium]|nr:pilus assembly protein PilM [Candidatus Poribacteria bacterium]